MDKPVCKCSFVCSGGSASNNTGLDAGAVDPVQQPTDSDIESDSDIASDSDSDSEATVDSGKKSQARTRGACESSVSAFESDDETIIKPRRVVRHLTYDTDGSQSSNSDAATAFSMYQNFESFTAGVWVTTGGFIFLKNCRVNVSQARTPVAVWPAEGSEFAAENMTRGTSESSNTTTASDRSGSYTNSDSDDGDESLGYRQGTGDLFNNSASESDRVDSGSDSEASSDAPSKALLNAWGLIPQLETTQFNE